MKMGKHFDLPVDGDDVSCLAYKDDLAAAAHAINCHDELVTTLETVRQEIIASAAADQRNDAGLLTDSALWASRAVDRIDDILKKAKGE